MSSSSVSRPPRREWGGLLALLLLTLPAAGWAAAPGAGLVGSFHSIAPGSNVNLTAEGELDWVHWGLLTETSLDRKSGVVPQISDFSLLDAATGFSFAYWFGDNANGYSWTDGTPTPAVNGTTTGVWAYGTPVIGSGFSINAPADTATRTLRVYVGAFAGRGRFEASLSDNSARAFTDTSLVNQGNGPSGVYTLIYSAASAGQQLVVKWTLQTPMKPDANVTLQAATLTATNVDNLPVTSITSPADNASVVAGQDLTISATASDLDGAVSKVEFFRDDVKLGEATAEPYSLVWSNVPAGFYTLTTQVTDDLGGTSTSSPVDIFVHTAGGSLSGNITVPPALASEVDLTVAGTRDWAHWGYETNSLFNHKAGVVPQISNYTLIGTNPVERFTDNFTGFSWSDGTPTVSASSAHRGIYTTGVGNGFELEIPADTTVRTLKLYVGLYAAAGKMQAWLGDFSAAAYVDRSLTNVFGNAYGVYSLSFAASSAGQSLHVRYRAATTFDADFGNVTLQAATLNGTPVMNGVPTPVELLNPHWAGAAFAFSFATQTGAHYAVQATPTLLLGPWQTVTNVSGNGAAAAIVDVSGPSGQRFYRIVQ